MPGEKIPLYAMHDPGGEHLFQPGTARGWIVFTEDIQQTHGRDYTPWTNQGFTVIVRLNWGYGTTGTIPRSHLYGDYANACRRFVTNSKGAYIWIIGNEPNHANEWPDNVPIYPVEYATCYNLARNKIKEVDPTFKVGPAPVAPYDATLKYPTNENGDWVTYFRHMLEEILKINKYSVDFIPLHAYTHGPDPRLVFESRKMDPPFENREYNFLVYREFLWVIPKGLKDVPVFITECDIIEPWPDEDLNAWFGAVYDQIESWNRIEGIQKIFCVAMFRWPHWDPVWGMEGKNKLTSSLAKTFTEGHIGQSLEWKTYNAGPIIPPAPPSNPTQPPPRPDDQKNWERSYPHVLAFEGGLSLDPRDKGNWTGGAVGEGKLKGTKYGISAGSYPDEDIPNLTKERALQLYKRDYWDPSGAGALPWPLCLIHFDTAINAGNGRANKFLASSGRDPFIYLAQRLEWYTTLDDWNVWGAGWSRRIAKLMKLAQTG